MKKFFHFFVLFFISYANLDAADSPLSSPTAASGDHSAAITAAAATARSTEDSALGGMRDDFSPDAAALRTRPSSSSSSHSSGVTSTGGDEDARSNLPSSKAQPAAPVRATHYAGLRDEKPRVLVTAAAAAAAAAAAGDWSASKSDDEISEEEVDTSLPGAYSVDGRPARYAYLRLQEIAQEKEKEERHRRKLERDAKTSASAAAALSVFDWAIPKEEEQPINPYIEQIYDELSYLRSPLLYKSGIKDKGHQHVFDANRAERASEILRIVSGGGDENCQTVGFQTQVASNEHLRIRNIMNDRKSWNGYENISERQIILQGIVFSMMPNMHLDSKIGQEFNPLEKLKYYIDYNLSYYPEYKEHYKQVLATAIAAYYRMRNQDLPPVYKVGKFLHKDGTKDVLEVDQAYIQSFMDEPDSDFQKAWETYTWYLHDILPQSKVYSPIRDLVKPQGIPRKSPSSLGAAITPAPLTSRPTAEEMQPTTEAGKADTLSKRYNLIGQSDSAVSERLSDVRKELDGSSFTARQKEHTALVEAKERKEAKEAAQRLAQGIEITYYSEDSSRPVPAHHTSAEKPDKTRKSLRANARVSKVISSDALALTTAPKLVSATAGERGGIAKGAGAGASPDDASSALLAEREISYSKFDATNFHAAKLAHLRMLEERKKILLEQAELARKSRMSSTVKSSTPLAPEVVTPSLFHDGR